ncbi:CyaA/EF/ExoY family adenylyl cyclase toxin [Pseudomonas sp. MWU15-20650]|uniref:CyaA/EF/ExoY family adenylyl cyclase toxin n=1 Tax=Pseudomonas sp. MWU15-20650 TaxID=2933107 RepID=UPI00200D7CBF|nr:CyaA/EF/ExoY family adenylyl cyclase toxin [Pseudomonas sp. MWU15-20650]
MTAITTSAISPCAFSREAQELRRLATSPQALAPVSVAAEHVKEKTGIVSSHLIPLQNIAAQTNTIIGIRPVESVATGLIEDGHPTKDFHIKGKSADWGPQAGLICTDQAFSKLEKFAGQNPGKVASANGQVQACINEGHAVAVPLEISRNRLDELRGLGKLTELTAPDVQGTLRFKAQGPSHQWYAFEAKRVSPSDNRYVISHQGNPLEVLAKSPEGKALTADYDLHMVAPHLGDYGPQDKLPVPDVAHSVYTGRIDGYRQRHANNDTYQVPQALRADYDSASHFYAKEDPDLGNATPRITQMIGLINQRLVGDGERVVHHNADSGSPATDVATNYPTTFFLPSKLGRFEEICVINDSKEMAELVRTAKDSGYQVPLNPLWEKEVAGIKRSGFAHAQERLARAFPLPHSTKQ